MIKECKLRVTVKYEKLFENNLIKKGWSQTREGHFTKSFGSDTKAELHRQTAPFSGQSHYSVYVTDPETLTKKLLYEICDELEKSEMEHS